MTTFVNEQGLAKLPHRANRCCHTGRVAKEQVVTDVSRICLMMNANPTLELAPHCAEGSDQQSSDHTCYRYVLSVPDSRHRNSQLEVRTKRMQAVTPRCPRAPWSPQGSNVVSPTLEAALCNMYKQREWMDTESYPESSTVVPLQSVDEVPSANARYPCWK